MVMRPDAEEVAMRQHWTCAILLPAAVLLTTGCATRSWVRELVNKQEVEIDQRFAGVEKRLADDAQQIEGMGSRLQTVESSLTQTGQLARSAQAQAEEDRKSTRLNSSHITISYAVFCLKKKKS